VSTNPEPDQRVLIAQGDSSVVQTDAHGKHGLSRVHLLESETGMIWVTTE
jgi:hypothetical protein